MFADIKKEFVLLTQQTKTKTKTTKTWQYQKTSPSQISEMQS